MKRQKHREDVEYVWTKKTEAVSHGKKKAGERATYGGSPLKNEELIKSWKNCGYIEEEK